MQELPTEVKEEYLRKAVLFMQVHLKIGKVSPYFFPTRRQRRELVATMISERPIAPKIILR